MRQVAVEFRNNTASVARRIAENDVSREPRKSWRSPHRNLTQVAPGCLNLFPHRCSANLLNLRHHFASCTHRIQVPLWSSTEALRMRSIYRYALGLTVISITHCVVAQSQIPTARGMTSDHRYEVAATYSHVLTDGSFGRPNLAMNGFAASVTAGVLPLFQLTGDVGSYSRRGGTTIKSFLGGPQV